MANPIHFKVRVDPRQELERQLAAAPVEHGEELLVCYDILRTAHANGTLDLIQGLLGGRDVVAGKLAEYAKLPGGVAAIRNLLAAGKILMALDPDTLSQVANSITSATGEHQAEQKVPSLWQLARRATSEDSRRGLSFMTLLLGAVGKSLRTTSTTAEK